MTIKFAEQKIHEARQRVAAIDRELADLRRQSHSPSLSRALKRQMRKQCTRLVQQRCEAWMELVELVDLAEIPVEYMGLA
jgi:hypothetical protein